MFKYTFWVAFLRQIIHNWTVFPFKDSFNIQRARTSVWFMLEKNISQKAIEFYLDGDRCSQQFGCWNKGRLVLKKKKIQSRGTESLFQFNQFCWLYFLNISWINFLPLLHHNYISGNGPSPVYPPHCSQPYFSSTKSYHSKAPLNTKQNWKIFSVSQDKA